MRVDQMSAVEPRFSPSFEDSESLTSHAQKHLYCQDAEASYWRHLLGVRIVDEARDEYFRSQSYGPACLRLELAYQDYLGRTLHGACQNYLCHAHSVERDPTTLHASAQVIDCWWVADRVRIGAFSRVRNDVMGAYYLETGLIWLPWVSDEVFARRGREKALERDRKFGRKHLALHESGLPHVDSL